MKKIIIIFFVVVFSMICFAGLSDAKYARLLECKMTLKLHSVYTDESSLIFEGYCETTKGEIPIQLTARWKYSDKRALESIKQTGGLIGKGDDKYEAQTNRDNKFEATITASCDSDPWLNTFYSCSTVSASGNYLDILPDHPKKYPLSPQWLTSTQKSQLASLSQKNGPKSSTKPPSVIPGSSETGRTSQKDSKELSAPGKQATVKKPIQGTPKFEQKTRVAKSQENSKLKPSDPDQTTYETKPVIMSMLTVPLGALEPTSKLYVKGKFFGTQPGIIYMTGKFPGPVNLVDVKWSDTEIRGTVPLSMRDIANQTVEIRVRRSDGKTSNVETIAFRGRVEYTCDGHIIHGSDGSVKDCSPYTCYEEAGHIRCGDRCEFSGHSGPLGCADGYICSAKGQCIRP